MHRPIVFKSASLSFSKKTCFEDFSATVRCGDRIAIIGRNGSGKSSMLQLLCQKLSPSDGTLIVPNDVHTAYVEQTILTFNTLSGGQRINKRLSEALALSPNLLLLDEPTNHLDRDNQKSMLRMLEHYQNTLIIVSHDTTLLRQCVDTLWHIDHDKIHVFKGRYDDYLHERQQQRMSIEKELATLKREKKETHNALMKEQKRAAKSKTKGQKSIDQRKWPTVVSKSKVHNAAQTSGKKKAAIDKRKHILINALSETTLPEIIVPTFSLPANAITSQTVLVIADAQIRYVHSTPLLNNVHLSLRGKEHIALCGKNACGKSTLIKAILNHPDVLKTGDWQCPQENHIGYLDQHYSTLSPKLTVIDHIKALRPEWDDHHLRCHLNDFLFKKNEDVTQTAALLSGGEKARLSLCMIAAQTPRLLILDEITNNLDLETKEHVTQVLSDYPGAMICISHDHDFLKAINVDRVYCIENNTLKESSRFSSFRL